MAAVFQRAVALNVGIGHHIKVGGIPFQPLEVAVGFVAGKRDRQHKCRMAKQIVSHVWLVGDLVARAAENLLDQRLIGRSLAQLADRDFFQIDRHHFVFLAVARRRSKSKHYILFR